MFELRTLSLSGLLFVSACGSYEYVEPEVTAADCSSIRLSGDVQSIVTKSDTPYLRLRVPEAQDQALTWSIQPHLSVEYPGPGVAQMEMGCPKVADISLLGRVELLIESDTPIALNKLAVYGGSRYAGPAVATEDFEIRGAGSAQVTVDDVEVDSLRLLLSGQTQLELSGIAGRTEIEMGGQSLVAASGLTSQWLQIRGSGQSQITTQASAHLSGRLSDQSVVAYRGNPDVSIEVSDEAQLDALD